MVGRVLDSRPSTLVTLHEFGTVLSGDGAYAVEAGLQLTAFVRIARRKLRAATVYEADMTAFQLPGRYDGVLCLFSSNGYLRTPLRR